MGRRPANRKRPTSQRFLIQYLYTFTFFLITIFSVFYLPHLPQLGIPKMSSSVRQRHSGQQPASIAKAAPNAITRDDRLLGWDDLPVWAKDNEYIHSGFRPYTNSYLDCLKSCFYIHNETGNIYSHLTATLWMLILPVIFYPYARENYPKANYNDWTVFGLFFLGGAFCFGLSTSYHVVSNHSHAVHDVYHRLDLLGISTVTAGCFPPGLWYTFPCTSRKTKMFWISVSDIS